MPCSQQRPIGFIVLCENIQNGRICRSPEQRIHASVNHLMVQCVRPTTKIFTDFTSIDFEAVKIGCPCTARYGIDGLCTLLYAGFVYRAADSAADFTRCREMLHRRHKQNRILRMEVEKLPYRVYGVYGNFEVRFSFLIRQRVDHLNAHKTAHPLAADMDIVGGLYIVKALVLRQLRAETVVQTWASCALSSHQR